MGLHVSCVDSWADQNRSIFVPSDTHETDDWEKGLKRFPCRLATTLSKKANNNFPKCQTVPLN